MKFSAKKLSRAGLIAALYAAATVALGSLAYGPVQIRPAEALTLLPLFFAESIFGLFIGCFLANLFSGYMIYDITFGSLATLAAAALTYIFGRMPKKHGLRLAVGGSFPVLLNAFILPAVWLLAGISGGYFALVLPVLATQAVWVWVLGTPLYFALHKLRVKNNRLFTD